MYRSDEEWTRDLGLDRLFEPAAGSADRVAEASLAARPSRRGRLLAALLLVIAAGLGARLALDRPAPPQRPASASKFHLEARGKAATLQDASGQVIWIVMEGDIG